MRGVGRGSLLLAACVLALSGCMTPQALRLREQPPAPVELTGVPYFAQQDHQCGPATLAMVLGYLGQPVSPESLAPDLYLPAREGTLAQELTAQARRHGYLPEQLAPDLRALTQALADGTPVIVLQNNGLSWYPLWHYAVLIGVDPARGEVILRSGAQQRLTESWSVFDRTWARGERWAIRLLDPRQPWPVSTKADALVPQLLAFARTQPALAMPALRQGVARWPQQVALWLALANAEEGGAGVKAAEAVLREGLAALPDTPWLLNNLADALLRQGRASEALPLAQRAVAGMDRQETRDTLQAVEAALAAAALMPAPDDMR